MTRKTIVQNFSETKKEEGKKTIKGFGQKTKWWWWSSGDLRGRQRVKQFCGEKGGSRDSEDKELLISLLTNVAF